MPRRAFVVSASAVRPPGGVVLPVRQLDDPVLRQASLDVTRFDSELSALVEDMFATMRAHDGVGLAANQIGRRENLFVYDCPDETGARRTGVIVNPRVVSEPLKTRTLTEALEGCLSVVGDHAVVARAAEAIVEGHDVQGRPIAVGGTGLLARCLQHELDHLAGRLFIDRLRQRERKRVIRAHREALVILNSTPDPGTPVWQPTR